MNFKEKMQRFINKNLQLDSQKSIDEKYNVFKLKSENIRKYLNDFNVMERKLWGMRWINVLSRHITRSM